MYTVKGHFVSKGVAIGRGQVAVIRDSRLSARCAALVSRVACRVGFALSERFLVIYSMHQLFPTETPTSGHSTVSPSAKSTQTQTCE